MTRKITKQDLYDFEDKVVELFNDGQLKSPVHLSGSVDGNLEDYLMELFKKIKKEDWVFTTYRSHYHALLKGMPRDRLLQWVKDNKSIHVMDSENKIFTTAIVGGHLSIAVGTALAIKMKNSQRKKDNAEAQNVSLSGDTKQEQGKKIKNEQMPVNADNHVDTHVYVFCGDMTSQTGVFHEVFKYAVNHKLPIKFIIENNFLSTDTDTAESWGVDKEFLEDHFKKLKKHFPDYFDYVTYERKWPHYGTGQFVSKLWEDKDDVKAKGF